MTSFKSFGAAIKEQDGGIRFGEQSLKKDSRGASFFESSGSLRGWGGMGGNKEDGNGQGEGVGRFGIDGRYSEGKRTFGKSAGSNNSFGEQEFSQFGFSSRESLGGSGQQMTRNGSFGQIESFSFSTDKKAIQSPNTSFDQIQGLNVMSTGDHEIPKIAGFRMTPRRNDSYAKRRNISAKKSPREKFGKLGISHNSPLFGSNNQYSPRYGATNNAVPILPLGYYSVPSMDEMATKTEEELSSIQSFTIGRKGVGIVTFEGLTDVRNMDLRDIVLIEDGSIKLYPNPGTKPRAGEGLNKEATLTILNCYPRNSQGEILTQQSIIDQFKTRLEKKTSKFGHFLYYLPDQGAWIFHIDSL